MNIIEKNINNLKAKWIGLFDPRFIVSLAIRVFGAFAILVYMTVIVWKFEEYVAADMFFLLATAPLVSSILKAGQENRLIIIVARSGLRRSKPFLISLLARYILSASILAVYFLSETEYSKFLSIIILGQFLAQHSLVSGYLQAIGKLNASLLVRLCYPGIIILVILSVLSAKSPSVIIFNCIVGSYLIVFVITVITLLFVHRRNLFNDLINKRFVRSLKMKNAFAKVFSRTKNRNYAVYEILSSILQVFPVLISGVVGDSEAIIFFGYLSKISKVPKVFVSMYTNYALHDHAKTLKMSGISYFFTQIIKQAKGVFFSLLCFSISILIVLSLVTPKLDIEIPLVAAMEDSLFVVFIYLLGETFGAPSLVMANRFLLVNQISSFNCSIYICLIISSIVFIFDVGIMSIALSYLLANLILIFLVSKFHANSL